MKKMMLSLLCAVMAFPLVSVEPEKEDQAIEKKIAQLEEARVKVRKALIDQRRKEIIADKYAAKLAKEILTLNQELSEYLDTKPKVNRLNKDLQNIEKDLRSLKTHQASKKNDSTKAGK